MEDGGPLESEDGERRTEDGRPLESDGGGRRTEDGGAEGTETSNFEVRAGPAN